MDKRYLKYCKNHGQYFQVFIDARYDGGMISTFGQPLHQPLYQSTIASTIASTILSNINQRGFTLGFVKCFGNAVGYQA